MIDNIFEIKNKKISFYIFNTDNDCLVLNLRKIFYKIYKDEKFELELKDVKIYHNINIPFVDFFSTQENKLYKFILDDKILIEKGETVIVSVKKQ